MALKISPSGEIALLKSSSIRPTVFSNYSFLNETLMDSYKSAQQSARRSQLIRQQPSQHALNNGMNFGSFADFLASLRSAKAKGSVSKDCENQWTGLVDEGSVNETALAAVKLELEDVNAQANKLVAEFKNAPPSVTGVRILELFAKDLVGRDTKNAKIFENQAEVVQNEFIVTWGVKCVALSILLLINLYFIFACMLYGKEKGVKWQQGWLIASVINLILDIFIRQMNIVGLMYCLIPDLMLDKARKVKQGFNEATSRLFSGNARAREPSTSDYLFVSAHVARAFPDLLESSIVLSYSSQTVSEEQWGKWKHLQSESMLNSGEDGKNEGRFNGVYAMISVVTTSVLMSLGSQSVVLQTIIISALNPLFIGVIGFLGTSIYPESFIGIPIVIVCLLALLAVYLWRNRVESKPLLSADSQSTTSHDALRSEIAVAEIGGHVEANKVDESRANMGINVVGLDFPMRHDAEVKLGSNDSNEGQELPIANRFDENESFQKFMFYDEDIDDDNDDNSTGDN